MALNFPDSPTDGQIFTDTSTGEQWQYTASGNYWTSLGLSKTGGLVYKGGVDITAVPPTGVKSGWVYTVTTGGTPNAGYVGLPDPTVAGSQIIYDGTNWQVSSYTSTLPDATETIKGIIELATAAEVTAGTDTVRAVTPAGVKVELDKKAVDAPVGTAAGTSKYVRQVVTTDDGAGGFNQANSWVKETNFPEAPDGVAAGTLDYVRRVVTAGAGPLTQAFSWVKAAFLPLAGGNLTGALTQTERTITAGAFDLATGNFWTCGAIAVPNPTNAVAGMSGLIRLTAAPTGWGSNFKHAGGSATAPTAFPAIVPFYVQAADTILVGKPVEGMA